MYFYIFLDGRPSIFRKLLPENVQEKGSDYLKETKVLFKNLNLFSMKAYFEFCKTKMKQNSRRAQSTSFLVKRIVIKTH